MLEDFIVSHRDEVVARCHMKVRQRTNAPPTPVAIEHGVPVFLDELIAELRNGLSMHPDMTNTAAKHGHDMLLQGLTPAEVVHNYGDVCQVITEMAMEQHAPISSDDFRMLNRCLDDAIASAITQYGSERETTAKETTAHETNHIRVLGDALRATIVSARAAFQAITEGKVGFAGSTGMVLERSLTAAEHLNDRMQAEVLKLEM
jgi:hypothetical protein